jgi:hypothetical protein
VYWEIALATTIAIACVSMVGRWFIVRNRRRRREAELARHSITPEQLSQALAKRPRLPLFDLREPFGGGGQFRDHPRRDPDVSV